MKIKEDIVINKFGFYSLRKMPNADELEKYYADKYYQVNRTTYQKAYSKEEVSYIYNKIEQRYSLIQDLLSKDKKLKLLDVGCGEGFSLSFFSKKNWTVKGLDFSKFGITIHNPDMKKYGIYGDVYDSIKTLKLRGDKFDLVWIDNVLEHVVDPLQLLSDCYALAPKGGILLIEVPNDFSKLQMELKKQKLITEEYWLAPPNMFLILTKKDL